MKYNKSAFERTFNLQRYYLQLKNLLKQVLYTVR